ncbi:MAG: clan AA aspartic protease [Armatimonadetes bacterium]|nr:clan AA aspartic protease [Armatimonadota bacterium]
MILGEYDADGHGVIVEITISDGQHNENVPAVLDTGFTGFLMLPVSLAGGFRFAPLDDRIVELGDGRESRLDACEVIVSWHGKERAVRTFLALRTQALIGMKLLRGSLVTLELLPGGYVTVEHAG